MTNGMTGEWEYKGPCYGEGRHVAKAPNLDGGMVKVSARLCSFLELENFFQITKSLSEVTLKVIVKKRE